MTRRRLEPVLTPRMRRALERLAVGEQLNCAGRPTRQRLAKHGLARYLPDWVPPENYTKWDGPLEITPAGRRALGARGGR